MPGICQDSESHQQRSEEAGGADDPLSGPSSKKVPPPPKFIEVLTPHLVNAILEEKTDVQSA
jgi:hypothetical protein